MPDAAHLEKNGAMIPATLTPAGAAARAWDVVVVGAGPAGAVTALLAAKHGAEVLLVDRATFPRQKVCGCCLNGRALDALAAAGLADLPARLGAVRLDRVTVAAGGREATLPLPGGMSLSRAVLDAALVLAAVEVGVSFLPGTAAKIGPVRDGLRLVDIADHQTGSRVVVAADGLTGQAPGPTRVRPSSRIGAGAVLDDAPRFFAPGTVYMATAPDGYVGLVRVEDGRLDVAGALDAGFVRQSGGPGPAAARVLRQTNWPAIPAVEGVRWKGTPPLTRRPRRVAGERWFAVGDAAGYVEPFTGEGMAWAVSSAVALAPLAAAAARGWDDRFSADWAGRHARLVGRGQRICRLVAAGLRSPLLTRVGVRLLAALPSAAAPFVHRLNRPPCPAFPESPA